MNLPQNKHWKIRIEEDRQNLQFYGKYADGLQMLLLALGGVGSLFLLGVLTLPFLITDDWTIFWFCLAIFLIVATIFIFNLRMYSVIHEIDMGKDTIVIKKIRGKKVKVSQLNTQEVLGVKMTADRRPNESSDLFLLIISPVLWFIVGAGAGEPSPAFYTQSNSYPFFEFGSDAEKARIVNYLQHWLQRI